MIVEERDWAAEAEKYWHMAEYGGYSSAQALTYIAMATYAHMRAKEQEAEREVPEHQHVTQIGQFGSFVGKVKR